MTEGSQDEAPEDKKNQDDGQDETDLLMGSVDTTTGRTYQESALERLKPGFCCGLDNQWEEYNYEITNDSLQQLPEAEGSSVSMPTSRKINLKGANITCEPSEEDIEKLVITLPDDCTITLRDPSSPSRQNLMRMWHERIQNAIDFKPESTSEHKAPGGDLDAKIRTHLRPEFGVYGVIVYAWEHTEVINEDGTKELKFRGNVLAEYENELAFSQYSENDPECPRRIESLLNEAYSLQTKKTWVQIFGENVPKKVEMRKTRDPPYSKEDWARNPLCLVIPMRTPSKVVDWWTDWSGGNRGPPHLTIWVSRDAEANSTTALTRLVEDVYRDIRLLCLEELDERHWMEPKVKGHEDRDKRDKVLKNTLEEWQEYIKSMHKLNADVMHDIDEVKSEILSNMTKAEQRHAVFQDMDDISQDQKDNAESFQKQAAIAKAKEEYKLYQARCMCFCCFIYWAAIIFGILSVIMSSVLPAGDW